VVSVLRALKGIFPQAQEQDLLPAAPVLPAKVFEKLKPHRGLLPGSGISGNNPGKRKGHKAAENDSYRFPQSRNLRQKVSGTFPPQLYGNLILPQIAAWGKRNLKPHNLCVDLSLPAL